MSGTMKRPHDPLTRTREYTAANLTAARIIAADPRRYAGLMHEWALLVLRKQPAHGSERVERMDAA